MSSDDLIKSIGNARFNLTRTTPQGDCVRYDTVRPGQYRNVTRFMLARLQRGIRSSEELRLALHRRARSTGIVPQYQSVGGFQS